MSGLRRKLKVVYAVKRSNVTESRASVADISLSKLSNHKNLIVEGHYFCSNGPTNTQNAYFKCVNHGCNTRVTIERELLDKPGPHPVTMKNEHDHSKKRKGKLFPSEAGMEHNATGNGNLEQLHFEFVDCSLLEPKLEKCSAIDLTDKIGDGTSNETKSHQPPPKSVSAPKKSTDQSAPVQIPYNDNAPNTPPMPHTPRQSSCSRWKEIPPTPIIKIGKVNSQITVSWFLKNLNPEQHAQILTYQIYAYKQSSNEPALAKNWKHIGNFRPLALPMAVTLNQFQEGCRFYFAARALDWHNRYTDFSSPKTWL